jgi:hypothetical protein
MRFGSINSVRLLQRSTLDKPLISMGNGGVALAALTTLCFSGLDHIAQAQVSLQINSGIAAGATSCVASNNGTGHMVCAEYTTSGSVVGQSWQATPGGGTGNGREAAGTLDPTLSLGSLTGTSVGAPGCAPEDDGTGTAACLFVSQSGGAYNFQVAAFYPGPATAEANPNGNGAAGPTFNSPTSLLTLPLNGQTFPTSDTISSPSCASTNTLIANQTTIFTKAVACAIIISGQVYGVAFEPRTATATTLTALSSLGTGFVGDPNCTSNLESVAIVCAARQGSALLGFNLAFSQSSSGGTPSIATTSSISLGSESSFAGDPACAVPSSGNLGDNTALAICVIVSGNSLLGLAFDPQDNYNTGFETLGSAPAGAGSWTGNASCTNIVPFGNVRTAPMVSCALTSSTANSSGSNIYALTFNPAESLDVNGTTTTTPAFTSSIWNTLATGANATLSCLPLNIDISFFYCGSTTSSGAVEASILGVDELPPSVLSVLIPFASQ